jgi:hypothetical protein
MYFDRQSSSTTHQDAFCDEENLITVTGFTEEEAVDFLQQKKGTKAENMQHYRDLAQQLGYLPMASMSNTSSPSSFFKISKNCVNTSNNFRFSNDDNLTNLSISDNANNSDWIHGRGGSGLSTTEKRHKSRGCETLHGFSPATRLSALGIIWGKSLYEDITYDTETLYQIFKRRQIVGNTPNENF